MRFQLGAVKQGLANRPQHQVLHPKHRRHGETDAENEVRQRTTTGQYRLSLITDMVLDIQMSSQERLETDQQDWQFDLPLIPSNGEEAVR
jgi:hypothetical protein